MTHGFTAEVLALSTEDKDVVAEQLKVWVDYYKPANPGEALLVENMAKAASRLHRCSVYETALLNAQFEAVPLRMMADAEDRLDKLREGLGDDPAASVRQLERSYDGPDTRLLMRYHKEAHLSFHRNYKELQRVQAERLAEALAEEEESAVETVSASPVSGPPEAVSRNEANPRGEPPSKGVAAMSCAEPSESVSTTLAESARVSPMAVEPPVVNGPSVAPASLRVPSTVPRRQRLV